MIDFHSHILPGMDDGAKEMAESLAMLRQSFLQGVDLMVSTSHFYADDEYPRDFLKRRWAAYQQLQEAMLISPDVYPSVVLGAEVLYFPGISQAKEVPNLTIGDSGCILIEPPMEPWSDELLDEIACLRDHFGCTPVIAHVDRFMHYLQDQTLMERVRERDMMVQVNAGYFLNPRSVKPAVKNLKKGHIQLIGSDCHNLDTRPPNLGLARKQAKLMGVEAEYNQLHHNAARLLQRGI